MVRHALILCVIVSSMALPTRAMGQLKTAAIARIRQLNKMAMEEYDSLEFDKAKSQLLEALKLAASAKVEDKSVLGTTHLNLAVVHGAGFDNKDAAVKHFLTALQLDRKLKMSPARATPALEKLFTKAQQKLGPLVPEESAFRHDVVDEAPEGRTITLRVVARETLGAVRVLLFYRKSGTAKFIRLEMTAKGDVYRVTIPAAHARGRSIYYYVEAQDKGGGRLAGSGEAASPNIISLLEARPGKPGQPGSFRPADDEGEDSIERTLFSLGVVAGTGGGVIIGGDSEHTHPRVGGAQEQVGVDPGGAWSPLHVGIELAYHVSSVWQVSLMGRLQLLNGVSGESPKEQLSYLGMLRARRFFTDGLTRFFLSFGAGAGQIRHQLPLKDYDRHADTPNDIVDSRVSGIAAFSFGGGLQLALTRYFGFVLEITGVVLAPDFTAHADLNIGMVFSI